MNAAQLHLILNHIPVVGVPIALLGLIYARMNRNDGVLRAVYGLIFLVALVSLPVFWTGEPAEHIVEKIPGVTEAVIEAHEGAAEFALIVTLLSGFLAVVGLMKNRLESVSEGFKAVARFVPVVILLVLVIDAGALGYAAHLGGKIRHSELNTVNTAEAVFIEGESDDDD